MSVAFVLSGGASLGAIQVGMLRALVAHDIRPDVIVGTSVGALNGAFIASRPFTSDSVEDLAGVWRSIRRSHVFPVTPLNGVLGFLGTRRSLVSAGVLRHLIATRIDARRLEALDTPLHVIACDLMSGDELRISDGPLADALLASAAIPGVLPPVNWNGRLLVDGGVINNTPITHALELGADRVYVLPTGRPCGLTEPPRGALGVAVQATTLMVAHRLADDAIRYRDRSGLTILPAPCPIEVAPMDFGHAEELMARAEAGARAVLDGGILPVVPLRGRDGRRRPRSMPTVELPPAA